MASKDDHNIDIDFTICSTICSELDHYIEVLGRKIIDLDRKKEELEDMKKRLSEILMQHHQSDDGNKKEEAGILKKRLDELISKFLEIKESVDLDVGGPSQEEGRRADDVKIGTEFNQSGESGGAVRRGNERKGEDVLDTASDSTAEEEAYEVPNPKIERDAMKRMFDKIKGSSSSSGEEDNDDAERHDGLVHLSGDLEGVSTLDEETAQELRDLNLDIKISND